MNDSSVITRCVVLAFVLAAAAGMLTFQGQPQTLSLALVLMGAMTVGGMAPRRWWWLGTIVGVGVTVGTLAAANGLWTSSSQSSSSHGLFGSEWLGLFAPVLVAIAASGVGASLQRSRWTGREH